MILRGKCKWACLHEPNTTFEPAWSINLVVDETNETAIKAAGLPVKVDGDGATILKVKRKTTKKNGEAQSPPTVMDHRKQPITETVGNGSLVNVKFSVYEYSPGKRTAYLQAVQVLELVPYGDGEDFEVEEQFDEDIPY